MGPKGLLAGTATGRQLPVLHCTLHHAGVCLQRQGIDLTVQVHWNRDGPTLGWEGLGGGQCLQMYTFPDYNTFLTSLEMNEKTFMHYLKETHV